jgi:maleate isomerase
VELIEGSLTEDSPRPGNHEAALEIIGADPVYTGVGVVVPNDFVLDHELWRWVPPRVTLHLTRLPVTITDMTEEVVGTLADATAVRAATEGLLMPRPSAVAYACSSGSFLHGVTGEQRLVNAMLTGGAPVALTTSGAMVQALSHIGARRIALVTPYLRTIAGRLRGFLGEHDIDVVSEHSLGIDRRIWDLSSPDLLRAVRDGDHGDADAVFVSCTNLRTYDLIAPLEDLLGKPVITANQATMWATLRAAGCGSVDPGRFLHDQRPDLPEVA